MSLSTKFHRPYTSSGSWPTTKIYWQNLPGATVSNLRLPPRIRDLTIDYTALSLAAPEKIHFKYKLEGQDSDWREVINDREVQYSNLRPGPYRFRVIAATTAAYGTSKAIPWSSPFCRRTTRRTGFARLCASLFMVLLWAAYQ